MNSLLRFNVTTTLSCVNRYLLMPSSLSTARYAHGGELFARLELEDDLSGDSMAGRLVLQSSQSAWIAEGKKERPEKVYCFFFYLKPSLVLTFSCCYCLPYSF